MILNVIIYIDNIVLVCKTETVNDFILYSSSQLLLALHPQNRRDAIADSNLTQRMVNLKLPFVRKVHF